MPDEKIAFIANPAAGKGREGREGRRLRAGLERAGVAGEWLQTSAPDDGIALAERSAREGATLVVAVGGDGTVNEVVGGLMRVPKEGRPLLAVFPAGTGNDYSRVLGLTKWDVEGAADAIRRRDVRTLDAGEVNGRFFANSVGLGFDGAVAETAAKVRYLKGFPAYLWSVFKVLRTWENFELTLTVDGRTISGRALLAAVANGPRSGGGFLLAPDAKADDGLFDVCRLGDLKKLEALRHLPKALDGSHVGLPWVTILRAREVVLASDRPLTAHVDGNLATGVAHPDPLRIRILPRALRVLAPAGTK